MASLPLADAGRFEVLGTERCSDWSSLPEAAQDGLRPTQHPALLGEGRPPTSPGGISSQAAVSSAISKKRRNRSGPKSKSSPFIGVSQYKRTGRWEAHIWDSESTPGELPEDSGGGSGGTRGKSGSSSSRSKKQPQKQGRQIHLGSFLTAIQAARAYDRAAIFMRGADTHLNFQAADYENDPVLQELAGLSKKEMILAMRKTVDTESEQDALRAFNRQLPAAFVNLLQQLMGLPVRPELSQPQGGDASISGQQGTTPPCSPAISGSGWQQHTGIPAHGQGATGLAQRRSVQGSPGIPPAAFAPAVAAGLAGSFFYPNAPYQSGAVSPHSQQVHPLSPWQSSGGHASSTPASPIAGVGASAPAFGPGLIYPSAVLISGGHSQLPLSTDAGGMQQRQPPDSSRQQLQQQQLQLPLEVSRSDSMGDSCKSDGADAGASVYATGLSPKALASCSNTTGRAAVTPVREWDGAPHGLFPTPPTQAHLALPPPELHGLVAAAGRQPQHHRSWQQQQQQHQEMLGQHHLLTARQNGQASPAAREQPLMQLPRSRSPGPPLNAAGWPMHDSVPIHDMQAASSSLPQAGVQWQAAGQTLRGHGNSTQAPVGSIDAGRAWAAAHAQEQQHVAHELIHMAGEATSAGTSKELQRWQTERQVQLDHMPDFTFGSASHPLVTLDSGSADLAAALGWLQ